MLMTTGQSSSAYPSQVCHELPARLRILLIGRSDFAEQPLEEENT
jgi:hypothetical protein